jgi:hypothetical protein
VIHAHSAGRPVVGGGWGGGGLIGLGWSNRHRDALERDGDLLTIGVASEIDASLEWLEPVGGGADAVRTGVELQRLAPLIRSERRAVERHGEAGDLRELGGHTHGELREPRGQLIAVALCHLNRLAERSFLREVDRLVELAPRAGSLSLASMALRQIQERVASLRESIALRELRARFGELVLLHQIAAFGEQALRFGGRLRRCRPGSEHEHGDHCQLYADRAHVTSLPSHFLPFLS